MTINTIRRQQRGLVTAITTALLALLLSGCQSLLPPPLSAEQQLTEWLNNQHYQAALDWLDTLNAEDPAMQTVLNKRDDVRREFDQYIDIILSQSKQLRKEKNWPAALSVVALALEKNPGEPRLAKYQQSLQKEQQQLRAKLELQLAMNDARTLPKTLDYVEQLHTVEPDNAIYTDQLEFTRANLARTQQMLLQAAQKEIAAKRWPQARELLKLAAPLQKNDAVTAALKTTEKTLAEQSKRENRSADREQQKHKEQKLTLLQQALAQNLLNAAVDLGKQLEPYTDDPAIAKELNALQQKITKKVDELTASGQALYAKGQLDEAIKEWRFALSLQPDNTDLKDRVQRAERFKANFDKLRGSDS